MKSVLLTGAGGGIGNAVLSGLLAADANRVLAVTNTTKPAQFLTPQSTSKRLISKSVDLSSYAEISGLQKYVENKNISFDWIVMAHGYIDHETVLEDQSRENIIRTFEVNIMSIIYLCQGFIKKLNGSGGIISISSTAGLTANGKYAVYSASKAAVNNFMQALARNRPDFSFVSVCAGPTRTPMLDKIRGDPASAQGSSVVADLVLRIISENNFCKSGDILTVRDGQVNVENSI